MGRAKDGHLLKYGVSVRSADDFERNKEPPNYGWRCLFVRRRLLLAVAIISASLSALLIALYLVSDPRDGFRVLVANQFLWTYGPTAVLVSIVAIWRQIDMHTKSLAPWKELTKGESEASRSVLLDYVSPLQVTSFFLSIRNKHWNVASGVLAFTIIKVVTLASTALFVLLPTRVAVTTTETVQTAVFNGSRTTVEQFPTLNDSSLVYTTVVRLGDNQTSADDLLGSSTESCRDTSYGISSASVKANLTIIKPEFKCARMDVQLVLDNATSDEQHPDYNLRLPSTDCRMADNRTGTPAYALNPTKFFCPPRQLSPLVQPIICEEDQTNWHLITLTDFRYEQQVEGNSTLMEFGDPIVASRASTVVNQTVSIACRLSYQVYDGSVSCSVGSSGQQINVSVAALSPRTETLEGLSNNDLSRLFRGSLSAASDAFGNVLDGSYLEEYPNTLVKLMARQRGRTYESLFIDGRMELAASDVSGAITAAIFTTHFLQPAIQPIEARAIIDEDRLFVNITALWIMVAGLVISGSVALSFSFLDLRPPIPHDPDRVLTSALILAQGPEARDTFRSNGSPSFFKSLEHFKFGIDRSLTNTGGQQQFLMRVLGPDDLDAPDQYDITPPWWRPLVLRPWASVLSVLSLILSIGALELLQHFSDRGGGFPTSTLQAGELVPIDLRNVFPLVALLLATTINALDFNIAVLAPFQAAIYNWTNSASILTPVVGKMPPHALYSLFKSQNWGPFLSGIAAILASALTIVSSGLYTSTLQTNEVNGDLQTIIVDTFDASWPASVLDDGDAAVVASAFETSNRSYPASVYEELALPKLSVPDASSIGGNDTITVAVPAMRASVICESAPATQYNVTGEANPRLGATVTVQGSLTLPQGCLIGGPDGNSSTFDFNHAAKLSRDTNSSTLAKLYNIHLGGFNATTQLPVDELDPTRQADNPAGCPSLLFIYGFVDLAASEPDFTRNTTILLCSQHLDIVPTRVHYALEPSTTQSGLLLSPHDPPPSPISTLSPTPIPASPSNASILSFPFRPQLNLDRRLAIFSQTKYDSRNSGSSPVDPFFQAVIFGRHPVPEEYFASSVPAHQLAVQRAIQGVYRRYMAHVIDAKMRRPRSGSTASLTLRDGNTTSGNASQGGDLLLSGTLTRRSPQLRIVQNRNSTIILQALLGAIAALVIAALALTQTREVIGYNPCCFAGVAALWAGSRFAKEASPRVLFMEEKAMKEEMRSWEFKLGWWEEKVPWSGRTRRRWGLEGRIKLV